MAPAAFLALALSAIPMLLAFRVPSTPRPSSIRRCPHPFSLGGGGGGGFHPLRMARATQDMSKEIHPDVRHTVSPAFQSEPCPFTEDEIIALTKKYVQEVDEEKAREQHIATTLADDYVYRGPITGPFDAKAIKDKKKTSFSIEDAFPDLNYKRWGFSVDPDDPYRCYFLQRLTGSHLGTLDLGHKQLEPTGRKYVGPPEAHSCTWNKDGKLKYETVGYPVDRFSGNSGGRGGLFGLRDSVSGLELPPHPGSKRLGLMQRLRHAFKLGDRSWSRKEDVPEWWKSKAKGAQDNSMERRA